MSKLERQQLWQVGAVVALLHVLGWGTLLLTVVPARIELGSGLGVFSVGLGLTAYTLGMRHAFDADHIAAIDNTTRRLHGQHRPASTVGFWFSLGHSSIVVLMCLALVLGLRALGAQVADEGSGLHRVTAVFGPAVAGVFLLVIAMVNLRSVRRMVGSAGAAVDEDGPRGPVVALVEWIGARMDSPPRMYVVGFLFGLGFDTATEVSLLLIAGAAAVGTGVPWYAVLTLPILFAAGMSLLDTTQGAVMRRAYGWAAAQPGRRLRYNVTVTTISAAVALAIAVVSLGGAGEAAGLRPLEWIATINLDWAGLVLTGVLLAVWAGFALHRRTAVRAA